MKNHVNTPNKPQRDVAIVSVEHLDSLSEKVNRILALLQQGNNVHPPLINGKYISKKEAMKLLDKKSTFMYELEKAGTLNPVKVGRDTYYEYEQLLGLFENSKRGSNEK